MGYFIALTAKARKDVKKIQRSPWKDAVVAILNILKQNPWQNPPPYEKLSGEYKGACARRINIQHRLVYQVFEEDKTVKIISMWSHYE